MKFIRNDRSVSGSTRDRTLTMRFRSFRLAASDFSRKGSLLSLFIPFLNLEGHNLVKEVILSYTCDWVWLKRRNFGLKQFVPLSIVKIYSKWIYPRHGAEWLVDPLVPVTWGGVHSFGIQSFLAAVVVYSGGAVKSGGKNVCWRTACILKPCPAYFQISIFAPTLQLSSMNDRCGDPKNPLEKMSILPTVAFW